MVHIRIHRGTLDQIRNRGIFPFNDSDVKYDDTETCTIAVDPEMFRILNKISNDPDVAILKLLERLT